MKKRKRPASASTKKWWLTAVAGFAIGVAGLWMVRPCMSHPSKSELRAGAASEPAAVATEEQTHGHTNGLIHEKSPYLLMHAHNPVDWYPWGQDEFAKISPLWE